MRLFHSRRMMQRWLDLKITRTWSRLSLWMRQNQPVSRLLIILAGLVLFYMLLPPHIQSAIWYGLKSHRILAGMLLVFSLLAVSLVWSTGQQFDAWAFFIFNIRGPRPAWLDRVMSGFTQIGSAFAALGIAMILYLSGYRLLSYELILGTLTLWLVVELVKFLANRSRPFIRLAQARVVGYRAIGRSFPSGHTSQAFFVATLITRQFQPGVWVICLLYAAALLVGITRMYVGAHYPRDVLAGALLGSAWGGLGIWGNYMHIFH